MSKKIKSDSKYFSKYANRFKTELASPNVLVNKNNDTITDPGEIVAAESV